MKKMINVPSLNKILNSDDIYNVLMTYNTDIVYLGGSLIEGSINPYGQGMGNKYSDIDVFILRKHENYIATEGEYNEKIKKTNFFTTPNGISFDIEIYDRDDVDNMIELLENSEINTSKRVLNYINFPDGWNIESANSFFCRIKNSICIFNEDAYKEIIAKINFGKFIYIYKYFLMNSIDNIFQDIIGNKNANQIETALLCAREACYNLIGIILLNEDEMYDRKKWLFIKFKNLVETKRMYMEELESCRQLFFGRVDKHEEAERIIHKFLSTMEKSLENIMIGVDF